LCFDIFGIKSLELANSINVKVIKIHSTDLTNLNLLKAISKTKISQVILGVGGGFLSEIKKAVSILENKKLILMLGFQGYPTKTNDNQVERLSYIRKQILNLHSNFSLGFADHPGKEKMNNSISILSIGLGAKVIERHLTLGKVMKLEDFESALNPDEFMNFVQIIRASYRALIGLKNTDNFGMSKSEKEYRKNIKRHVVSLRKLEKGTKIKPKDVTLKRTASDDVIYDLNEVYGKSLNVDLKKNKAIQFKNIN
jgi:N,N'-diacetyllegionaminate synthase